MLQPAYGGPTMKRSRSRNKGAAVRRIACDSSAQSRIQSIKQERLIVVDLHVGTEARSGWGTASRDVEDASLLPVDFDERLGAGDHHRPTARAVQRDVFERGGIRVVADKHAGIVWRIAVEHRSREIDRLAGGTNGDGGEDIILSGRNHDPAR